MVSVSALALAAIGACLLALASCSHDLYAISRSPRYWIPVSAPPKMIGDEYHYFGLLAMLHRKFLNRLFRTRLREVRFSPSTRFQLGGMLINLMPYSVGYLLVDRRYGVLAVRLFNRFWLFLGVLAVAMLIVPTNELISSVGLATISALVFYLTYPPPTTTNFKRSIACNLNNKRHIFDKASSNDLTRAMFSETSGPVVLWVLYFCLLWLKTGSTVAMVTALVLSFLSFFTYWPSSVVAGYLLVLSALLMQDWFLAAAVGLTFGGATIVYYRSLSKSELTSGFFLGQRLSDSLNFGKGMFFNTGLTVGLSLVILALSIHLDLDLAFPIILVGLSSFVLFLAFGGHHLSRLWDRGAQIPYALLLSATSVALIFLLFNIADVSKVLLAAVLVMLLIALLLFELGQALFLWKTRSNVLEESLMLKLDGRLKGQESITIPTDSFEEANAVLLYTCDWTDLYNFSLQCGDVSTHLTSILGNFRRLGWPKAKVFGLLTAPVGYDDWLGMRPLEEGSEEDRIAYAHTLQYWATNREYNHGLRQKGLYDVERGWTETYRALLESIWSSLDSDSISPENPGSAWGEV